MNQPVLKTRRLLLRSFNLEDANKVQNLAGNYNVSKTTLNIPYPYESGMAEEWINPQSENWKSRTSVVYAITLSESDELVGAISLMQIDGIQGELGYWIGEPYWRKGYCTEAAEALIQFSFDKLKISKIFAEHLTSNPASGEVMKKVGMLHSETTQKVDRAGRMADIENYEIRNT